MEASRPIYFLSGLGADRRMFAAIRLPQGYHAVHLDWFLPVRRETMAAYAQRMCALIPEDDPILAGLSFGGMMAQEIARIKPVSQLILISTIKSRKEMPLLYRLGSVLKLQMLFGKWMLVSPKFISYYIFGVKKPAARRLLDMVLNDLDPVFLRWAIRSAASWEPRPQSISIYHIHGQKDRIFPIRYIINPDKVINGGHLIVMTHSREVSQAVAEALAM